MSNGNIIHNYSHIHRMCEGIGKGNPPGKKFLRAVLESWCSLKSLNWILSSNFVSRSGSTTHEEEDQ